MGVIDKGEQLVIHSIQTELLSPNYSALCGKPFLLVIISIQFSHSFEVQISVLTTCDER